MRFLVRFRVPQWHFSLLEIYFTVCTKFGVCVFHSPLPMFCLVLFSEKALLSADHKSGEALQLCLCYMLSPDNAISRIKREVEEKREDEESESTNYKILTK